MPRMTEFCDDCKDRRVAKLAVEQLKNCEYALEAVFDHTLLEHTPGLLAGLLQRVRKTLAEVEA